MVDHYTSSVLKLANSIVTTSPGFALDIGCSAAKLVFRSKEDYENGKPKKEELKGELGQVHILDTISRNKLDDVIQIIKDRVDLLRVKDEKPKVRVTGAGSSFFREKLERELDVEFDIQLEFECFIRSFVHLSKHLPKKDFFLEEPPNAREMARLEVENFRKISKSTPSGLIKMYDIDNNWEPEDDNIFPSLIGMCGSACAVMTVDEGGKFKLADGTIFGGRTFLGLCSMLVNVRDYTTLEQMFMTADGRSCDQHMEDLMVKPKEGDETDVYNQHRDNMKGVNRPLMPMGKAAELSRDMVKGEDMVQSLYRCFCVHYSQIANLYARREKISNVYFVGNVINNEKARYYILSETLRRNALLPEEDRLRVRFIRHGGHLGCLGAFIGRQEWEQNKEEKKEEVSSAAS